jgi:osmotically-inducible protein OsmY
MKRYIAIVALLALSGVLVVAQNMPRQSDPMPQTQQQPATSGQEKAAVSAGGVQSDIQAALQKEPTLATANINVQVSGKSVELLGTVPSKDAKDTAEQIAKAHSGGLDVKNHLKVGPASTGAPPK